MEFGFGEEFLEHLFLPCWFFLSFYLSLTPPVIGNEYRAFSSQKVVVATVIPKETSTHVGMTKACEGERSSRPGEIPWIMDY